MVIIFKYDVGEKVRVVGKDIEGEITKRTHFVIESEHSKEVTIKYCVKRPENIYTEKWIEEKELIGMLESTNKISKEYIDGVYNVLVDVNLKDGKFDTVHNLTKEKEWEKERN